MIPKGAKQIKIEEDEKIDPTVFIEVEDIEEPKKEPLDFYKNM